MAWKLKNGRVALAIALITAAAPAAALTPLFGQVGTGVFASFGGGARTAGPTSDYIQWAGSPISLFHDTSFGVLDLATSNRINLDAYTNGTWAADGRSGGAFLTLGWRFDIPDPVGAGVAVSYAVSPTNWVYEFTATADGTIDFSYFVRGAGSLFGLQGWNIHENGAALTDLHDPIDPRVVGDLSRSLVAGQTYRYELRNNANITSSGTLDGVSGFIDGGFRFTITEDTAVVPEPASWALMLAGFGLVGAALRRAQPQTQASSPSFATTRVRPAMRLA